MENMANPHFLIQEGSLKLLAYNISRKTYMHKVYQRGLLSLSQTPADMVTLSITSRLGQNGVVGVLDVKFYLLDQL